MNVFDSDSGVMMKFDNSLDLVSELQEHIEQVLKIPVASQVLLVGGGTALSPSQRVSAYSAGSDTNPIFLYNKQYYVYPSNTAPFKLTVVDSGPELMDLHAEMDESLVLEDTTDSIFFRSYLASSFYEMAEKSMQACKRLIDEQHLQHQGFKAMIDNIQNKVSTANSSAVTFLSMLQEFLENKSHYLQLTDSLQDVAATLATIPLLPSLVEQVPQDPMTSIASCKDIEGQRDNMSLLDWLQPYISSDSVHQLSQTCTKGLQQYNEEMVSNIQTLLTNLETNFGNKAMRSIGGISARFSGLEKLLNDVDQIVQEQEDLTDVSSCRSNVDWKFENKQSSK
ncbi:RB1-inducible coiled-coil protein 1-like [Homalodisca vitripennis]|uniref:RB1-inducible coiled-coil protein 1-like n=1 Tax=Homalodisca vitripennis TaxID=197043 RepID=UPI001EEA463A|nr:RB1-inducible coiled-coil protein 1-like [Homalodisca vitripennis]